jgi:hypothetical protein
VSGKGVRKSHRVRALTSWARKFPSSILPLPPLPEMSICGAFYLRKEVWL